jgi:hypothetical protein
VARAPAGRLDVDLGTEWDVGSAGGRDAIGDGKHGSGDVAWFLAVDPAEGGDVLGDPGGRLVDAVAGMSSEAEKVDDKGDGIAGHLRCSQWCTAQAMRIREKKAETVARPMKMQVIL